MNILELSEQEIVRREALNELRNMGIEPYPAAEYPTNAFSADILNEFKDEDEPRSVCIAGRLMSRRIMGKASFIELQDSKGRIQVYITRDELCPGENKDLYNVLFKRLRAQRKLRLPVCSAVFRCDYTVFKIYFVVSKQVVIPLPNFISKRFKISQVFSAPF